MIKRTILIISIISFAFMLTYCGSTVKGDEGNWKEYQKQTAPTNQPSENLESAPKMDREKPAEAKKEVPKKKKGK